MYCTLRALIFTNFTNIWPYHKNKWSQNICNPLMKIKFTKLSSTFPMINFMDSHGDVNINNYSTYCIS